MFAKKISTLSALLGLFSATSTHAKTSNPKPKIPHSHHSAQGGEVLMFGDDHVEVKASDVPGELFLYVSDKMREPVDSKLVKLEVTLVDGAKRSPVHLVPSGETPFKVAAHLPGGKPSPEAKLEIRAPRITPVKGQVSGSGAQSLPLSKILKAGASMPAKGHEGH